MIQVKLRGVMPSAHLPRSRGGISNSLHRARTFGVARLSARGRRWFAEQPQSLPRPLDPSPRADVTPAGLPAGDAQDPLDGRRVGRVLGRQPAPHRPPGQRQRGGGERLGVGRVDVRGQLVEQVAVVAEQIRPGGSAPAPGRARPARSSAAAARGGPGCAGTPDRRFDGSSTTVMPNDVAEPDGRGPAQAEDRAPGAGTHPGQTRARRAAQQVDQHGLGLVVGGVPGQHVGGQHRVAGVAGPRFQVRPDRDVDRLGSGTLHRTGRRPRPRRRPRRPNRAAGRGRRAPRSPRSRRRRPAPSASSSRRRRTRRR